MTGSALKRTGQLASGSTAGWVMENACAWKVLIETEAGRPAMTGLRVPQSSLETVPSVVVELPSESRTTAITCQVSLATSAMKLGEGADGSSRTDALPAGRERIDHS